MKKVIYQGDISAYKINLPRGKFPTMLVVRIKKERYPLFPKDDIIAVLESNFFKLSSV